MKFIKYIQAFILIFSLAGLSAETVILKNGTMLKGSVRDQDKDGIKLKFEDGREMDISKKNRS